MLKRHPRLLASGLAALLLAAVTEAASPTFWQVSTRADFLKGDVENLSIDNEGRLILAPATQVVFDSTAPFLWAVQPGPGGTFLVGSGNEGKVFRVDPSGKADILFDAMELEVHAVVSAPGGDTYVATSPDGKVYRVDAKGTSSVFFDPEDKYIWSLAVDTAGNVYAGTGEKGVIYKIAPDGKGAVFFQTKATHVITLAFDPSGSLLAGTESPGRVLRFDRDGRPFVLLDSPFREIRAICVSDRGVVYAAAVAGRAPAGGQPSEGIPVEPVRPSPVASVSTEITSIAIVDMPVTPSASVSRGVRDDRRAPKGAVYRIATDGTWESLWESPEDTPYDLLIDRTGALLIGTGNKGKIFQINGDNPAKITLLARAGAQQVTRFSTDGAGGTYFATANPGRLFRLAPGRAESGSYESEVRDTQTVSAWGTISWRASVPAGGKVEVLSRSGNSDTPDDTWSPWSAPYDQADGQAITSPSARFFQWKALLAGKESPVLTSVTVPYLQRNLRPLVSEITVHPPGTAFQKPFSTGEPELAGYEDAPDNLQPAGATSQPTPGTPSVSSGPSLGRRTYQKGLQTFTWKGQDDNDDRLQFDVLYRREGETTWRPLKRGLSDPIFVWDTTSVPNGTYLVKIVATDSLSNPPGADISGEFDSVSFDIDNTPPAIRLIEARKEEKRSILVFEVQDDQSAIQRVDYSIEADRWKPIYPRDGICDSRLERFELTLEGNTVSKSLVLRAVDVMNNAATARGELPEKPR